jgi:hypothetical protein
VTPSRALDALEVDFDVDFDMGRPGQAGSHLFKIPEMMDFEEENGDFFKGKRGISSFELAKWRRCQQQCGFYGIFGRENLVATPKTNQNSFNFSLFSDVMLLFTSFGVTKTIRI